MYIKFIAYSQTNESAADELPVDLFLSRYPRYEYRGYRHDSIRAHTRGESRCEPIVSCRDGDFSLELRLLALLSIIFEKNTGTRRFFGETRDKELIRSKRSDKIGEILITANDKYYRRVLSWYFSISICTKSCTNDNLKREISFFRFFFFIIT